MNGIMKNVQIIDAAQNCTFSVFQFTEVQFALLFPNPGQDIAFADELLIYLTTAQREAAFEGVWDRPIAKSDIIGLHGTLFYEFEKRKQHFPVSRREYDFDPRAINFAQRELNDRLRSVAKNK